MRFMPHGHCYLWEWPVLIGQVVSNALIALSYLGITAQMLYILSKRTDIPFHNYFSVFIFWCGITHIFDIIVIWRPYYYLDTLIRLITAIISVSAALFIQKHLPKMVKGRRSKKDVG